MGKYVVYVRARDERELEAAGLDPGEWVRHEIRKALNDLARNSPKRDLPPMRVIPEASTVAAEHPAISVTKEVTPDFKDKKR